MQGVGQKTYCSASGVGSVYFCVCVCLRVGGVVCGFGRLKVTVITLRRPAHLPQSVSNQSCSVKHAASVIGVSVLLACVSLRHFTCIWIDMYSQRGGVGSSRCFLRGIQRRRVVMVRADFMHYYSESKSMTALSFQPMLCFVALQ